jgi:hypothetical protein
LAIPLLLHPTDQPAAWPRLIAWAVVVLGVVLVLLVLLPGDDPPLRRLLLNEDNRFSEAQLITFGWFVTIVSAYLACGTWNIAVWDLKTPLPLQIDVQPQLWVLAGIVSTGLVGDAIVRNYKKQTLGAKLFVLSPGEARLSDVVTHDERDLRDTVDLSKVQQLLFQLAALVVYIVSLGRLMAATAGNVAIDKFPIIPNEFLALLGISTLAALTYKAVPKIIGHRVITRALRPEALDAGVCQAIVYGETGTIEAKETQLDELAEARRFIAGVAYKRNGSGLAKPKYPSADELKQPFIKRAWDRCKTAAQDAKDDDVGTCKHFVIWYSDDGGKTPSKQPKEIEDKWPYEQTDKIKKVVGSVQGQRARKGQYLRHPVLRGPMIGDLGTRKSTS